MAAEDDIWRLLKGDAAECDSAHSGRHERIKNLLQSYPVININTLFELPEELRAYIQSRHRRGYDGIELLAELDCDRSEEQVLQLAEHYGSCFPDEACAVYEASLARLNDPRTLSRGYCLLGDALYDSSQWDRAEEAYNSSLAYQEHAASYRGVGHIRCERDLDFLTGREYYQTAYDIAPQDPDTIRALMQANTRLGEWSEALTYCRRLIQHCPHERLLYEEARNLRETIRNENLQESRTRTYEEGQEF